jgi:5-methyltetrahydropteroyltriglutamate--homocysteine methyltransferase
VTRRPRCRTIRLPEKIVRWYSALRHLPAGRIAALGVVSSKHPPVETREQLVREIEQAARHVDIGQPAISPQCGFASVSEGDQLSPDDQWAKLEAVPRIADEVWGR